MQLTLADLMSHATQFAQVPLADPSLVSRYVNMAYAIVARDASVEHTPLETLAFASTSTQTGRLSLPTDHDYTLGIKLGIPNSWSTATSRTTVWKPIQKQLAQWFDAAESVKTGEPERYADYATWLEFDPSPDSAYSVQLRYTRKISELTLSTSTPLLDEDWHWAIALKGAELTAAALSDATTEARNAARAARYMAQLTTDQAKKRMDPRGMHVTFQRRTR